MSSPKAKGQSFARQAGPRELHPRMGWFAAPERSGGWTQRDPRDGEGTRDRIDEPAPNSNAVLTVSTDFVARADSVSLWPTISYSLRPVIEDIIRCVQVKLS